MNHGRKRNLIWQNVDTKYRGKYDELNQDMWWVLIKKTLGEALLRVKGVEQGQGMEATAEPLANGLGAIRDKIGTAWERHGHGMGMA